MLIVADKCVYLKAKYYETLNEILFLSNLAWIPFQ